MKGFFCRHCFLRVVGFLSFVVLAFGQDQDKHPYSFDVATVKVGSQSTLKVEVQGRWFYANDPNGDYGYDPQSTEIHCYQRLGFCEKAQAFNSYTTHKAFAGLEEFEVLRWNEHEIIADNHGPCIVETLRFDLDTRTVSLTSAPIVPKQGRDAEICRHAEKGIGKIVPTTAFLVGQEVLFPKGSERGVK